MFDTMIVAKRIRTARNNKNMTQMNLADAMGVSYQAVSNWERGNSMPDISKIPDLCNLLEISFEELVGGDFKETKTVKKLINDDNAAVTMEELADVAPILPPKDVEKVAKENEASVMNLDISTIVGLAPFLDDKTLNDIAYKLIRSGKSVDKLLDYMDSEDVSKLANEAFDNEQSVDCFLDYMDSEDVGRLAMKLIRAGKPVEKLLDYMDGDDIPQVANEALEKGLPIDCYIDYMDEDDIGRLATKCIRAGKTVDKLLDHMDEDDVLQLANEALEKGQPVEYFLDYMDEDQLHDFTRKILKSNNK